MIDPVLRDWNEPENFEKIGYFGSERDGGFAEYTAIDVRNVHPVESDLEDAQLATFAVAYNTAENMLQRVALAKGEILLVTGASGGVGSALIQLANRRGAKVIALCGEAKAREVAKLNPLAILPRVPDDLPSELLKATGRPVVDIVADVVGGPNWHSIIDILRRGGRYVCSGAIAGPIVELDLRELYLRDLRLIGATATRPGVFADLVRYIERNEIRPLLAATYPLKRLVDAQRAFIAKEHVGNIVVTS